MFPQRLKELRSERGLTQEYIGKILHVSYKTVGAWERGTRQPSIETVQKLSKIFEVSTDYLLGLKHDEKVELDNKDTVMTYQGKVIPKEDLEVIRRFLRGGKSE